MEDIIDDIILKEGGSKATDIKVDKGGRTQYGISEKSNPTAWEDGKVTRDEAREIYERKYLRPFKLIEDQPCYEQAVDFGVTSGPALVVQKIQAIVGAEVDGHLGPDTQRLVLAYEGDLNLELCKSRLKMIGRIVTKDPTQLTFLNGWINRSLEFI